MKIIKYIMLPAVIIIMLIFTVTNSEGLNYWLTWGGNRAAWVYSDSGYIYPTLPIRMKAGDSLKYNGVTVTSGTGGGGIAASDNTTFTGINTFTDSLRANGYSLIDDAKITSYLRVTGEVTTDLNFNKGSSTSIGTISTDSLAFITNNTKRIVIDKNGYTVFTDTVQMLDRVYITGNLNVASNIYTVGNITADSIAGIGRFITDVDAITLKGQDTTHFARTDTLTTENIRGVWNFWNIVSFLTVPTIPSFFQNAARTIQYYLPQSASDTLLTRSQTQTITNKRIDANLNTDTNFVVETIQEMTYTVWSPADATTYYYGGIGTQGTFSTSASTWQIPIINTGIVTKCYFWTRNGTGGDGDADDTLSIILRKNNTTDYYVSVGGYKTTTTGGYDKLLNTSLSIPVASGDYLTMKIITPTWNTTNPVNMSIGYRIIIVN